MPSGTTLALIGIGGYGNTYVNQLLDSPHPERFRLVGVVDPAPASCRRLAELEARRVPVYESMEQLYAKREAPLLAVISTPLHLHAGQSGFALSRGSGVLCEKPLCVTPEQSGQMKRAVVQALGQACQQQAAEELAYGRQW